jgi:hypothetical protein
MSEDFLALPCQLRPEALVFRYMLRQCENSAFSEYSYRTAAKVEKGIIYMRPGDVISSMREGC